MKSLIHFIVIVGLGLSHLNICAQPNNLNSARPNVLLVTAHPDDSEGIAGGTLLLLRDSFQINIVIASRGERGLSPEPRQETARIREIEARNAASYLNANLFFLGQTDGDVYADKYAVDSLVKIINMLDPKIVITMWPIDVPDHLAAHNMTIKALWQTGQIHEREVYFAQAGHGTQTNQFDPDFFVNISHVVEEKAKLLRFHECQNEDDRIVNAMINANRYWGLMARCDYAEAFKVYYPLTNSRWKRPTDYTLLRLK